MNNPDPQRLASPSAAPLSRVAAKLLAHARRAARRDDAQAAMRSVTGALALAPDHPEVLRCAGMLAHNAGDYARAVDFFQHALRALPDDVELTTGLGMAHYYADEIDAATHALRHVCELAPQSAQAWYNLGDIFRQQERTAEQADALQHAVQCEPGNVRVLLALAGAQLILGKVDVATAGLRDALRADPVCATAWSLLASLNNRTLGTDDVAPIRTALAAPGLASESRCRLLFALAHALENADHCDQAFDAFVAANALRRPHMPWDGVASHREVAATTQTFSGHVSCAPDATLGHAVIFIVSLPRSGSTLVEQILASHPAVAAANEIGCLQRLLDAESGRRGAPFPDWVAALVPEEWHGLGAQYLDATAKWHARAPHFTDKTLINWRFVGAALSMLPGARVVLVHREAVETCLGCYRQYFVEDGPGYLYDLDEMADVYVDFARLGQFWCRQYPRRVLDFGYESLVAEPEVAVRGLLDFCGLDFDPACLAFHRNGPEVTLGPSSAQVRQPLHQGTARAARYGYKLDLLRQRLRAAGMSVDPFP